LVESAGATGPLVPPKTGGVQAAPVLVAVLGSGHDTCAARHPPPTTAWGMTGHVHALEDFGGVPQLIVPDHFKPLVSHVERFEVPRNRSYQEFAAHNGGPSCPRGLQAAR
jgi:transposase